MKDRDSPAGEVDKMRKIAQIHEVGKMENTILPEAEAKEYLLNKLRAGYAIRCSIYCEEDMTVYITIAKEECKK